MAKSLDFGNGIHGEEFTSFVAREVERVLAEYDEVIKTHTLIWAGRVAGNVASAANLFSPTHQRAIHDDLAGLAAELVHALAAEAARRFETSTDSRQGASSSVRAIGTPRYASSKAGDRKGDLESMRLEDWAGQVVGPTYLEEHCGIPRSTLHWWQRRNDVIALRKGARKHVFPLAQFVDGRPAPGIREVLSLIANPRLAWLWLIRPSPCLDGRVPIEMLRQDLVAEVVLAARDPSPT